MWFMLGGLAAVFVAFFIWGVTGTIPETADMKGTVLVPGNGTMAVYCYLPIDYAKPLEEGMSVRSRRVMRPVSSTDQRIGCIPVTAEALPAELGDDVRYLSLPSGNLIEVIVELDTHDDGTFRWSASKGVSISLTVGATCDLTVITSERRPYELIFR